MSKPRPAIPTITLRSGDKVPVIGLGTWKSKPGEVGHAVSWAIDAGYTHIDCALVYENETEVGEALSTKIKEGAVKREQLWITSKLWNTHRTPELIRPALQKTLRDLGTAYLDLYLCHWPFDTAPQPPDTTNLFPKGPDGKMAFGTTDYLDVWKQLEALVDEGLIRNIGLSNFNHKQIDRVFASSRIKPAVLQVECHPYFNQEKLIAYCKEKGVVFESYAPFGAPDRSWAKPTDPVLLQDPVLLKIAEKHKKTAGQVLLRFHVDRGLVALPKSVNQERIQQNLTIFDFSLDASDLSALRGLHRSFRYYPEYSMKSHPHYGFHEDF